MLNNFLEGQRLQLDKIIENCGHGVLTAIYQNFPVIYEDLSDKTFWKMKSNGEFNFGTTKKLFREETQCDPLLKKGLAFTSEF